MEKILRAIVGSVKSFWLVATVVSGAIGISQRMLGLEFLSMPDWVWWGIAASALGIQLVQQQMLIDTLSDEIADKRPADLPLEKLLERILKGGIGNAKIVDINDALEAVRSYAEHPEAVFRIFGENALDDTRGLYGKPPSLRISSDYWRDHRIVLRNYVDDKGVSIRADKWSLETEPMGASSSEIYCNMKVCSAQVDRVWTPPKTQITLVKPWRVEKKYR